MRKHLCFTAIILCMSISALAADGNVDDLARETAMSIRLVQFNHLVIIALALTAGNFMFSVRYNIMTLRELLVTATAPLLMLVLAWLISYP